MKIYVSNSLTQAPEEFKQEIEALKVRLRERYEILDWMGLTAGTPKDVYEHDMACVKNCDLLLAECSYPAIGLGMEIGLSLSLNKPVLAVAKEDAKVTRMVQGITHPFFTFSRYRDTDEILRALENIRI